MLPVIGQRYSGDRIGECSDGCHVGRVTGVLVAVLTLEDFGERRRWAVLETRGAQCAVQPASLEREEIDP